MFVCVYNERAIIISNGITTAVQPKVSNCKSRVFLYFSASICSIRSLCNS